MDLVQRPAGNQAIALPAATGGMYPSEPTKGFLALFGSSAVLGNVGVILMLDWYVTPHPRLGFVMMVASVVLLAAMAGMYLDDESG